MRSDWKGAIVLVTAGLLLVLPAWAQEETGDKPGQVTEIEESYQEHTVVPGDTLWDLSAKYLGDPWKWPEIWELNPFVTDPHWIYPDQALKIRITTEIVRTGPTVVPPTFDQQEVPQPTGYAGIASLPTVDMTFHLNLKSNLIDFISPRKIESSGRFMESYNEGVLLSDEDILYFTYTGDGEITIGDQFTVFRNEDKVKHPVTPGKIGWLVDTLGEIEVTDMKTNKRGDPVYTARIVDATASITLDDHFMPLESNPVRITVQPAKAEVSGYIVASSEGVIEFGSNQVVFLDVGSDHGVEVGNTFQVLRQAQNKRTVPPYFIGNVIIIKTMPETSTALVTFSRKELNIGDMVVSEVYE